MNWAHVHLMFNHVPVVGCVIATMLLSLSLWSKNQGQVIWSLWILVAIAVSSIPVFLTGDPAEDAIKELVQPKPEQPLIHDHEEAAELAFGALLVAGALALVNLSLLRTGRSMSLQRLAVPPLVLAIFASLLLLRAANYGGKIRHSELRSAKSELHPTQFEA